VPLKGLHEEVRALVELMVLLSADDAGALETAVVGVEGNLVFELTVALRLVALRIAA
jgi:hypothetical protein